MSELFIQSPNLAEFIKLFIVSRLPEAIINNILSYSYEMHPIAKLIQKEVEYYKKDHNYSLTRYFKAYFVSSFYSFFEYNSIRKDDPENFNCYRTRSLSEEFLYFNADDYDDIEYDELDIYDFESEIVTFSLEKCIQLTTRDIYRLPIPKKLRYRYMHEKNERRYIKESSDDLYRFCKCPCECYNHWYLKKISCYNTIFLEKKTGDFWNFEYFSNDWFWVLRENYLENNISEAIVKTKENAIIKKNNAEHFEILYEFTLKYKYSKIMHFEIEIKKIFAPICQKKMKLDKRTITEMTIKINKKYSVCLKDGLK